LSEKLDTKFKEYQEIIGKDEKENFYNFYYEICCSIFGTKGVNKVKNET
jgi:hypothetical protein